MKIKNIHVENFGKLHDFNLDFNEDITQIFGENGWGKSTFGRFLKAMFYGMSAKARGNAFNYERSKFMPWQGGNYGGFVEFEYQNQSYRLTRYFGKTPEGDSQELLNLSTMKVCQNPTCEIGEEIFGVGRETFEITAFFPQLNFLPSQNDEIKAGLTGANKFQDDQAGFERAIKIIDAKISQEKRGLYKKDEIERIKIAINENLSLKMTKREQLKNATHKMNEIEGKIAREEGVLQNSLEKNRLISERLKVKRGLETDLQNKTQQMNRVMLERSEEMEKKPPFDKKKLYICLLAGVFAVAFGLVCLANVIVGIIGVVVSLFVGGMVLILSKKRKVLPSRDFEGEIKLLTQNIDLLKGELACFEGDMILDDNSDLISNINSLKVERASLRANITLLENDITRLEGVEDSLNFKINEMKEDNDRGNKKIELLSSAKNFMLLAQTNVSQRFIQPLNSQFKGLLERFGLTQKDYVVDSGLTVKENTVYGQKELEYSSQGLQDIISFCQRLNLVTKIFKKEAPFILLDDTFVNLDDEKLEIAKEIVKYISKDFQIIYICCNSRCKIVNI